MSRRLVIMGSGETAPGMVAVHRDTFAAIRPDPTCVLLDSPFAFQENAEELVERIATYFAESLGHSVGRVHLPADADVPTRERALARLRAADWVFAGPGSPSYARRAWADAAVPDVLAGLVASGRSAALVFASAAAVTLGEWSLPVYEIYKVGEDPRWEPGLGLMNRVLGWRCSVVPHYDNQEGGTHDTRFCWVGERRLRAIEDGLAGGFILGIDEHTALVLDLDERTASVVGRGGVTLRVSANEDVLAAGTRIPIQEVERRLARLDAAPVVSTRSSTRAAVPEADRDTSGTPTPAHLAATALAALPEAAARERAAVIGLLELAEQGARDQGKAWAARAVQALVDERSHVRSAGDWARSDHLRDVLGGIGVEIRDSPKGSTWRWT